MNLEDLQILDMKFSDIAQVQEIARRLNLSHWSDKDYKDEIEKKIVLPKWESWRIMWLLLLLRVW